MFIYNYLTICIVCCLLVLFLFVNISKHLDPKKLNRRNEKIRNH